jgi:O2-independent ubiquinone biosynthesis accessory factor UbiT
MLANQLTGRLHERIKPVVSLLFSPKTLTNVAVKMPFWLNRMVLEKIINRVFSDLLQDGDFDFLVDRQLQIEISDAQLFVGISLIRDKIVCSHFAETAQDSDVTLSVNTADVISLAEQQIDPDTLFFQRKLKIRGDTELAHQLKNTIDTLDPNAIPQLALKVLGLYKRRILDSE